MLVLFLAATAAFITLVSIPQAAMQSQRVREQKLLYQGQEYQRAIELYFRKNKKYPQEFEDLENTNGVRFLRRKFKDPMTGEEEWRVIHMGPDGKFTDSLLYDLETPEEGGYQMTGGYGIQAAAPIGSIAAGYGGSGSVLNAFRGGDRARAIRESAAPDLPSSGGPDPFLNPGANQGENGQVDPNNPNAPYDPNAVPGQNPVGPDGQDRAYAGVLPSQVPQALGQRPDPNAIYGQPGQPGYPQQPGAYGQVPGQGAYPQQGGIGGYPQQAQAGAQPAGFGAAGVGSDASSMIRGLLTTPRPGGLAGLGGQGQQPQAGQPGFTGGIAGVASKLEEHGVLVYQGKNFYNEWEFVYDYRQEVPGGAGGGGAGGPGQQLPVGQPGLGPGGGFAPAGMVQPGTQPTAYPPGYPTTGPGNPYGQPGLPGTAPQLPGIGGPTPNQRGRGTNPNQPGGTQNTGDENMPPIPGTPAYYEWLRQQQQQNQQQNRQPGNPQGQPGTNQQNPNQSQQPGQLPFPNQPQPPDPRQRR